MCGIAAILGNGHALDARVPVVRDMMTRIAHRGPDGEGLRHLPTQAIFGHRRLAVIDLEHGAQPMVSADERYTLVFNGEIYNYRELRQSLASRGAPFTSDSDTEVLLQLLVHEGAAHAVAHDERPAHLQDLADEAPRLVDLPGRAGRRRARGRRREGGGAGEAGGRAGAVRRRSSAGSAVQQCARSTEEGGAARRGAARRSASAPSERKRQTRHSEGVIAVRLLTLPPCDILASYHTVGKR